MSVSQFPNEPVDARFEMRFDAEVQTFMRLLEAFALRGVMPQQVRLNADDGLARLVVRARLGAHDAQALAARLSTAVGVVDVGWRAEATVPVPVEMSA